MQPNTPNIFNSDLLNREEARAREAAARRRNSVDPGPSNMRALVEMLRSYSEDVPQQSPSLAPDQSPSPASARTQYAALSPDPQLQWWQRQERLPHPQQWPPPMLEPEPEPEQEQSGRSLTPENRPKFNSLAYNEYISNAESGNNPKLINTYHNPFRSTAGGSYGLTKAALQDVGKKNEYFRDKSIENLTYEQQTEAHNIFTEINRQRLKDRNIFDSFPQYDEHNLLSAAHLLGPSGLERFLTRGSFSKAAQDANGGRVNLRNIVLKRLNQPQPALYREGGKVKKPQSDSRWFIPSKPAKPALDLTYEPSSADDTEKNTYEEMLEYLKEQGIRINEDDSDSSDSPNETLSFVQQIDSEHERLEPSDPQNVVEVNLPKVRFMIDPRKSIRGPSGQATIGFVRDFAEGGLVEYDPDIIDQLAQEFVDSYQEGGEVVGIEPSPETEAEKILVPQRFPQRTLDDMAGKYGLANVGDYLSPIFRGAAAIPGTVKDYITDVATGPKPLDRLGGDISTFGRNFWEGVKSDPVGAVLDFTPIVGEVRSAMDAKKFRDEAAAAALSGDEEKASTSGQLAALATAGAMPLAGMGVRATRRGVKAGVEGAEKSVAAAVPAYERQLSPLGFYSHGAETAANLPQAKGTPEQFRAMLEKYGVKSAEMEGFDAAFSGRPSVTRDELAQHFNERRPQVEETVLKDLTKAEGIEFRKLAAEYWYHENSSLAEWTAAQEARLQELNARTPTKFHTPAYTLPGGENYREVLLKLSDPSNTLPQIDAISKRMDEIMGLPTRQHTPEVTAEWEGLNAKRKSLMYDTSGNFRKEVHPFQSTHWEDDPNVLAHLRMSDRTGPNGEKILHLEELQSDWGKRGRTEGFGNRQEVDLKPLEADLELVKAAWMKIRHNIAKRESGGKLNSLNDLRYQDTLDSQELRDLYYRIRVVMKADSEFIAANEAFKAADHALREARMNNRSNIPPAPYVTNTAAWTDLALKRAFKEAAEGGYDKIVWTPGVEQAKRYGLVDKKREGMMNYYDKMVPNQLSKLVKKLDPEAKIEAGRMPVEGRNKGSEDIARELGMTIDQINALPDAEKRALIGSVRNTISAPGITITPKMREAIMKGQTDFAEGGHVQGYAMGGPAGNSLAALYEKYHAEPTARISYAQGGSVDSAPVYDPAVIAAIAASITEDNYA